MRIQEHRLWLFEDVLNDVWLNQKDGLKHMESDKEKRIDVIQKEIEKAQERIFHTEEESLIKMYEQKLVSLCTERDSIGSELSANDQMKIDLPYLITNTKPILVNPLSVRHIPDPKLKSMLLAFIFSNQIYYNKKNGIQTPKIPLIYSLCENFYSNKGIDQGQQDLNSRREALETSALPLSYGPIV